MKKVFAVIFIFALFAGTATFAGNDKESGNPPGTSAIKGKIFDKTTNEELAGVTVQIEGTDIKAYTDIEGNFKIEDLQPGTYNLTVNYISYKETELSDVSIDSASENEVEIKLEQIN